MNVNTATDGTTFGRPDRGGPHPHDRIPDGP